MVYLVSQHLGPGLLCLFLVDMLHQDTLVLKGVALCLQVQLMVQVTINLLGLPEIQDTYHGHIWRTHATVSNI